MKRYTWSIASPGIYGSTYLPSTQRLSVRNQSCFLGSVYWPNNFKVLHIHIIDLRQLKVCTRLYQWFYVACANLPTMEHHTCVFI